MKELTIYRGFFLLYIHKARLYYQRSANQKKKKKLADAV